MAVRLAIRPRLTLPAEPRAALRPPRFRLPPLAVPAVGYWLAMGALTYAFAHLGPNPLEQLRAASSELRDEPAPAALEPAPSIPSVAPPSSDLVADASPPADPNAARPADVSPPLDSLSPPDSQLAARTSQPSRDLQPSPDSPPSPNSQLAARSSQPSLGSQLSRDFPEFSDSSRPVRREHAADGPRIDSLFERATDRPDASSAAPASPPETAASAPVVSSSCEYAIAHNGEQLDIGGPRGPVDVTREAYAGILQNGRYLAGCALPDHTVFEICAAVKDGHAIGITVVSSPPSQKLNACVRGAVARLQFPASPRLDVTHTRFDSVNH